MLQMKLAGSTIPRVDTENIMADQNLVFEMFLIYIWED